MKSNFYLKLEQPIVSETIKTGIIKGVAYSGQPIKNHGWYKNLIIDLSTLSIAKVKTPILLDHISSQVAGNGKAEISSSVTLDGKLFESSSYAKTIKDLAADGHEWEMSLGVYDGMFREFEKETINGIYMESGVVLENGVVREITVCTLGADLNTNAQIFSLFTKEKEPMKLNQHDGWAKFACGCGGTKDSTPDELQSKFEENTEEIAEKEAEIEKLKEQIEKLEKEIADAKAADEVSDREEELATAAKAKNIKLSEDAIKKAAASKEATEALKLAIDGMDKQPSGQASKFSKTIEVKKKDGDGGEVDLEDPKALQLAANKMVREKKAETFEEALDILTRNGGE